MDADAMRGFVPMPDDTSTQPRTPAGRSWRQAEVRRAINAAEQAGLSHYRIEIAPDGTIAIVVGAPAENAAGPDSA
jgi:hypothetical protein